jgi:hypothetical protein
MAEQTLRKISVKADGQFSFTVGCISYKEKFAGHKFQSPVELSSNSTRGQCSEDLFSIRRS